MDNQWQDTLWLAGLPLLVGIMFLLNWLYRAELRPGSRAAGASQTRDSSAGELPLVKTFQIELVVRNRPAQH